MDLKDLKEFNKLIKLAKKSGILELKVGNVEIKFSPDVIEQKAKSYTSSDSKEDKEYSDMDMLLWSSQGLETGAN